MKPYNPYASSRERLFSHHERLLRKERNYRRLGFAIYIVSTVIMIAGIIYIFT